MAGYRSIPFLLLFLLTSLRLQAQQDQEIDWEYEIDLLGSELAQKHKNLFFKTDSNVFSMNWSRVPLVRQDNPCSGYRSDYNRL